MALGERGIGEWECKKESGWGRKRWEGDAKGKREWGRCKRGGVKGRRGIIGHSALGQGARGEGAWGMGQGYKGHEAWGKGTKEQGTRGKGIWA